MISRSRARLMAWPFGVATECRPGFLGTPHQADDHDIRLPPSKVIDG
jgi:hypothetical protein